MNNKSLKSRYRAIPFANRILLWMFAGAVAGLVFGKDALVVKPLGDLFLQLLIMAAIPLVFLNLLAGITSLGSLKDLGKIGGKIMLWYIFSLLIASILGILVMSISGAGKGMTFTGAITPGIGEMPSFSDILLGMVPSNIFKSFAEGNLIQIVVFAILLSIVVLKMPGDQAEPFTRAFNKLATLMRKLVELILTLSPLCLGALMAATFGAFGSSVIFSLGKFIISIYTAQLLMVGLYIILLKSLAGISARWFFAKTREIYATTIATCSSLASLAVAMEVAETKMKLPRKVFAFALPMGAQFNKDGTAIMLSGILIFTAQAIGLKFSFGELIQIVLVGLLIVEGSTGIPGGGLVTAMLFAKAFNLPLEIVAIVGGIYRLIDMGNTTINVMGDMAVATIVSKTDTDWQPEPLKRSS